MLFTTTFSSIIKATETDDNNIKIAALEKDVKSLEEELTELKTTKTKVENEIKLKNYLETNNIDELMRKVKQLKTNAKTANTELQTKTDEKTTAQETYDAAVQAVKDAADQTAKNKAQEAVDNAKTALDTAQTTLDATQAKVNKTSEALTNFKNEYGFSDDFSQINH